MRVLAAMSGGVDSAVAAARAVDAGHEVTGVHLALSRSRGTLRTGSRGCCTVEDALDARRAADVLGIPFYVWDLSEQFAEAVVDDFVAEYAAGRTPNPCLRCNERIKFAALLEKALALGFDALCTGHYATVSTAADGSRELHRAGAWAKDQSYVLGVLTDHQLAHALFPLGPTPAKSLVREEAARRGLSVAAKPDSHDICFIPDGDTRGWLAERVPAAPGPVVDAAGVPVGHHDGAVGFTVGQRRGLHLDRPSPDGRPRFVLRVRTDTNTVVVGPKEALAVDLLAGGRMSWLGTPPARAADGFDCHVQVRAHADPVPATARLVRDGGAAELVVRPLEPIHGVAPGQSAVLYVGTRVLGQVTVDRTATLVNGEAVPA
ncbi:tRNA 2-thiouridine(34) synthase MnmA [uncultured Amnibacterium sp.]|uniref:tRNA 2-thiouridine(34) synthase MnmA n=1 Tax=uncultured Amnibacterium sp. TaxID=1631851 RepID=UPI0035CB8625